MTMREYGSDREYPANDCLSKQEQVMDIHIKPKMRYLVVSAFIPVVVYLGGFLPFILSAARIPLGVTGAGGYHGIDGACSILVCVVADMHELDTDSRPNPLQTRGYRPKDRLSGTVPRDGLHGKGVCGGACAGNMFVLCGIDGRNLSSHAYLWHPELKGIAD